MTFALRVLVAASIVIAHYLVRGQRDLGETFVVALVAFGTAAALTPLLRKHRVAGITATVAISAGVLLGAVLYRGRTGPMRYVEIDAMMADPDSYAGAPIKLHGYVELGSIRTSATERTFVLRGTKHSTSRVTTVATGPLPDTFRERAEVVATGMLEPDATGYRFAAAEITAKCPDTYQTDSGPQPAAKFR